MAPLTHEGAGLLPQDGMLHQRAQMVERLRRNLTDPAVRSEFRKSCFAAAAERPAAARPRSPSPIATSGGDDLARSPSPAPSSARPLQSRSQLVDTPPSPDVEGGGSSSSRRPSPSGQPLRPVSAGTSAGSGGKSVITQGTAAPAAAQDAGAQQRPPSASTAGRRGTERSGEADKPRRRHLAPPTLPVPPAASPPERKPSRSRSVGATQAKGASSSRGSSLQRRLQGTATASAAGLGVQLNSRPIALRGRRVAPQPPGLVDAGYRSSHSSAPGRGGASPERSASAKAAAALRAVARLPPSPLPSKGSKAPSETASVASADICQAALQSQLQAAREYVANLEAQQRRLLNSGRHSGGASPSATASGVHTPASSCGGLFAGPSGAPASVFAWNVPRPPPASPSKLVHHLADEASLPLDMSQIAEAIGGGDSRDSPSSSTWRGSIERIDSQSFDRPEWLLADGRLRTACLEGENRALQRELFRARHEIDQLVKRRSALEARSKALASRNHAAQEELRVRAVHGGVEDSCLFPFPTSMSPAVVSSPLVSGPTDGGAPGGGEEQATAVASLRALLLQQQSSVSAALPPVPPAAYASSGAATVAEATLPSAAREKLLETSEDISRRMEEIIARRGKIQAALSVSPERNSTKPADTRMKDAKVATTLAKDATAPVGRQASSSTAAQAG
eukprot:TRINITY_DN66459_c0_g1_i1.p1 TRINITY_DN66459_c0_g1~~TRINITY_DN66459_c0_g1_i1.p1  ORF type:complete len:681 (+),score=146.56 TRINITY_DN66459_c0_g1_i1:105-2147(+)